MLDSDLSGSLLPERNNIPSEIDDACLCTSLSCSCLCKIKGIAFGDPAQIK